jgi:NAD-dependent DNA ligase
VYNMVSEADHAYTNSAQPLLTDDQYDILRSHLERRDPVYTKKIGAPAPHSFSKVGLPYYMGSLNKIREPREIETWCKKYQGPYCMTPKLDGVSALYCKGRLYTRGDGRQGHEISFLLPYLAVLPKDLVLRGELVIQKKTFSSHFQNGGNARNVVAGLLSRKTEDPDVLRHIEFIVYEIVEPRYAQSEQFNLLKTLEVPCVSNTIQDRLKHDMMKNTLEALRDQYLYDVDGIVCVQDKVHAPVVDGNPPYAVAFKSTFDDQKIETTVLEVVWNVSKDGYLKPKIRVDPVVIQNTRIEYVTAFHAGFIEKNVLGAGAVVEISRSGDVIPHILSVRKAAKEAQLPTVPFTWNETHTEAIVEDPSKNETVRLKTMTRFFQEIGTVGIGQGQMKKLYTKGYDTIPKILRMNVDDFRCVYSETMAIKLSSTIRDSLQNAPLANIIAASNMCGRGIALKSIVLVLSHFPSILKSNEKEAVLVSSVSDIPGIGEKTAEAFVKNIQRVRKFLADCGISLETDARLLYYVP